MMRFKLPVVVLAFVAVTLCGKAALQAYATFSSWASASATFFINPHNADVADTDAGAAINAERVAELCAADWGLWRTTKVNTERVRKAIPQSGLEPAAQRLMLDRLDRLWQRIDAVPKPRAWRLRDRIGDRKRWYQEPDEVA